MVIGYSLVPLPPANTIPFIDLKCYLFPKNNKKSSKFVGMKYELAIFDLDGTLIDTASDLGEAANYSLQRVKLPTHSIEQYRKMVGHGVRNLIASACPETYREDKEFIDNRLHDFLEYYIDHIHQYSQVYPGMLNLVQRLHNEGCLCAVASNKFQEGTQKLIEHFFPEDVFVCIYGNRKGVPLKPDAQVIDRIIAEAAERSGKSADSLRSHCVIVGDAMTDIKTAQAAGIDSVAVSWGFKGREELLEADYIADTAEDLERYIMG